MFIIIGLGNPGIKFKNTRHNVGFIVLDNFTKENNFPDFLLQKKYNAEISESEIEGQKVILAKPQTFMNDSGQSAKKILSFCHSRLPAGKAGESGNPDLIVVHDDIDLPVGKIKIVKDKGSAGHKGIESIIKEIGTADFIRFRIGIAPKNDIKAEKIVLKNFSEQEKKLIIEAIKKTTEALNYFLQNGLEKTMNIYN